MKKYKPYEFSGLHGLMQYFYRLGWYGGTLDLLTITMKGGFEAFTGRASETWEHRWFVKIPDIPDLDFESIEANGKSLDDACRNLAKKMGITI